MPASEVAAERSGKSASSKSADGSALPETIVDTRGFQRSFFRAGIFEGFSDGAFPGDFGDLVIGMGARKENTGDQEQREKSSTKKHVASGQREGQPESCPKGAMPTVLRNATQ